MRYLFSEYPANYKQYHFPYQVYALRDAQDSLDEIYNKGFLPTRLHESLFLLSRQLRIDLTQFTESSENRRILRKVEVITMTIESLKTFPYHFSIGKLAKDFYEQKFGPGTMSAQKMKWLCTASTCTDIAVFKHNENVVGYCILVRTPTMTHYAYPFYDLTFPERNLGLGMMLKVIQQTKADQQQYVYLGTCYTPESSYKLQFDGLQYFTGWNWSSDLDGLKKLIAEPLTEDHLLSTIPNKKEFLEQLSPTL